MKVCQPGQEDRSGKNIDVKNKICTNVSHTDGYYKIKFVNGCQPSHVFVQKQLKGLKGGGGRWKSPTSVLVPISTRAVHKLRFGL